MLTFDRLNFWKDPSQAGDDIKALYSGKLYKFCQVDFYLWSTWGIKIAMGTLPRYIKKSWSILEFGCNTGHSLVELKKAGYKRVRGIEINPLAIAKGRELFRELKGVEIICAPIEDVIKDIEEVDVVFATGVFMHLPYTLDWVFEEIAKKTRHVILTSENEFDTDGYFKWARKYRDVYEKLGFAQVEEETGDHYPPLPVTTIKRVFLRNNE